MSYTVQLSSPVRTMLIPCATLQAAENEVRLMVQCGIRPFDQVELRDSEGRVLLKVGPRN